MNIRYILWRYSPDLLYSILANAYRLLHPRREGIIAIPWRQAWLFKTRKVKLLSPTLRDTAIIECLDEKLHEQYFKVERGDVVIDVGASIGEFTIPAAMKAGDDGFVLAIEPEPRNFAFLWMNVKLNKLRNVKLCRKAVANYKGWTTLYISNHGVTGHTLVPKRETKTIRVEVDTLDNIARDYGLDKTDFVKIDVEGFEIEVLKGADSTLNSAKKIVVECHSSRNVMIVARILKSKGFKVVYRKWVVYGIRM